MNPVPIPTVATHRRLPRQALRPLAVFVVVIAISGRAAGAAEPPSVQCEEIHGLLQAQWNALPDPGRPDGKRLREAYAPLVRQLTDPTTTVGVWLHPHEAGPAMRMALSVDALDDTHPTSGRCIGIARLTTTLIEVLQRRRAALEPGAPWLRRIVKDPDAGTGPVDVPEQLVAFLRERMSSGRRGVSVEDFTEFMRNNLLEGLDGVIEALHQSPAELALDALIAVADSRARLEPVDSDDGAGPEDSFGLAGKLRPWGFEITQLAPRGPAEKAGLVVGDTVERVNDVFLGRLGSDEVDRLLAGTKRACLLVRRWDGTTWRGELAQARIDPSDDVRVQVEEIQNGRAVTIGFDSFRRGVGVAIRERLSALHLDADRDVVLLDLTKNGGGLLTEVDDIVGLFSPGVASFATVRASGTSVVWTPNGTPAWSGPLIVLVGSGTASAAETTAAALQDHRRALVVGARRTFGKGTVQGGVARTADQGLRLMSTIAFVARPNGSFIHGNGVVSDIELLPSRLRREVSRKGSLTVPPDWQVEGWLDGASRGLCPAVVAYVQERWRSVPLQLEIDRETRKSLAQEVRRIWADSVNCASASEDGEATQEAASSGAWDAARRVLRRWLGSLWITRGGEGDDALKS